MVNIKKQSVKAYILLESLVALLVLVGVVSVALGQIESYRALLKAYYYQQNVLDVARMAVQTRQSHLTLNGVSVSVVKENSQLIILEDEKEVLRVSQETD